MATEKTITINIERNGRQQPVEVMMRYCAASETGYESLSGQSSDIFFPTRQEGEDGKTEFLAPKATTEDYIRLAMASIVAAYARRGEDTPITINDILYDISPEDIRLLILTVGELRNEWYKVSPVVKDEMEADDKDQKADQKNG